MEIDCGGPDRPVAKKTADCVKIRPLIEKVGGETMPEAMNGTVLGYAGFFLLFTKALRAPA